jgi:hypothetical protein
MLKKYLAADAISIEDSTEQQFSESWKRWKEFNDRRDDFDLNIEILKDKITELTHYIRFLEDQFLRDINKQIKQLILSNKIPNKLLNESKGVLIFKSDGTILLITHDENFITKLYEKITCNLLQPAVYNIKFQETEIAETAAPIEKYFGKIQQMLKYESNFTTFNQLINDNNIYKIYVEQNFPLAHVDPVNMFSFDGNHIIINPSYLVNGKPYSSPLVISGLLSQIITKQPSISFNKNTKYEL